MMADSPRHCVEEMRVCGSVQEASMHEEAAQHEGELWQRENDFRMLICL
jgi:hypothetical protein